MHKEDIGSLLGHVPIEHVGGINVRHMLIGLGVERLEFMW